MQESSAKLKVCTQTVPSGGRTTGYHRRSAVSFYLVTDGCIRILLQGREITVRENEGAFVNSGVLHSMESAGADAAVLQVTFPPEYVTGAEDPRLTARYADPIVKARERDCMLLRGSGWANDICDRLQLLPSVLSARRPGYELRAHRVKSLELMISSSTTVYYAGKYLHHNRHIIRIPLNSRYRQMNWRCFNTIFHPACTEPLNAWSQTAWRSRQKQTERRICQSLIIIGIEYFREWSCMRIIRYW